MHEVLNKARSECPIASLGDDQSAMVFPLLICRLMPHSRLSNDQGRLDITAVDIDALITSKSRQSWLNCIKIYH